MNDLADRVRRNRALWDGWATQYDMPGEENRAAEEIWKARLSLR